MWIYLGVSIPVVMLAFKFIYYSYYRYLKKYNVRTDDEEELSPKIFLYVVGLLLYQGMCLTFFITYQIDQSLSLVIYETLTGGHNRSRKLPILMVATAWCLATFVLSQAYNLLLITYVIAPNNPPFANSIYDVLRNPKATILVEKGMGLDVFFSVRNLPPFKSSHNLVLNNALLD